MLRKRTIFVRSSGYSPPLFPSYSQLPISHTPSRALVSTKLDSETSFAVSRMSFASEDQSENTKMLLPHKRTTRFEAWERGFESDHMTGVQHLIARRCQTMRSRPSSLSEKGEVGEVLLSTEYNFTRLVLTYNGRLGSTHTSQQKNTPPCVCAQVVHANLSMHARISARASAFSVSSYFNCRMA